VGGRDSKVMQEETVLRWNHFLGGREEEKKVKVRQSLGKLSQGG